jgi:hypothetical protein
MFMPFVLPFAAILAFAAFAPSIGSGQTLADVPGTVVYWRTSPASRLWPASNRIYTTSPSIVKLPNGDYLLAFNLFGGSLEPSAADGTTYIYRSSDKGTNWTNLTPQRMSYMKRGSLFVHGNSVYLWGYTGDASGDSLSGSVIIRKSTDNGTTWTLPFHPSDPTPANGDPTNGFIMAGTMGGTPFNPVIHDGRLWMAQGGKRVMDVAADANWLLAAGWKRSSAANTDSGPNGIPDSYKDVTITEAQIVASPQTGVVILPKVESEPRTVLIRATGSGTVANPTTDDWVDLPGGGKKFGAAYDPVSQRFYVLSNPVLPAHFGHSEPWNMIRNTAALMSSKDLKLWDVQQIFLYGPNIGWEGFQYLNFDMDGDDMIVASRTAFDLTGEPGVDYKPPRGHDSNLITFHRIRNFRSAAPDHYLAISGGIVQRHERTQHAPAPLGLFVMGSTFDGTPLGTVDGLAQGNDGEVLVREQGGRVLRFDALGNFLGTGSAPGVTFQSQLDVAQPPEGERGWSKSGGGDWDDLYNWYYWNRADTGHETANFGSAIGASATVTLNRARTVQGLRFRSPHRYTIAGNGTLMLASAQDAPVAETLAMTLAGGATVRGLTQNGTTYPLGYYPSNNADREIIGVVGTSGNRRNHNAILVFDLPEVLPEGAGGWQLTFHKSGLGTSQRRVDLYALDPRQPGFALNATLWHEGGVANNNVDTRAFATLLASEIMVNEDPVGKQYTVDVTSAVTALYNGRNRAPGVDKAWFRLNLASMPGTGADNRYQAVYNTPGQEQAPRLTLTVFEPVDLEPAVAEAQLGEHHVDVPVQLGTDAVITAHAGADLRFRAGLDLNSRTVQIGGTGVVRMGGVLAMNGGTLVLTGTNGLRLSTGGTNSLGGTLDWRPGGEVTFSPGDTFTLLANIANTVVAGAFDTVILPELPPGLQWDADNLYAAGTVSVAPDQAPNTPPSLTAPGNQTTPAGQTLQLQLVATDNDLPAQTLTFALLAGPDGAILGSASGFFQWRPPVAAAGTNHLVCVQATDDGQPPLADEKEFTITVPPFERPTLQAGQWGTGGFSLEVMGAAGPDYVIQVSTNLQVWTTLETVMSPALPFTWTDAEAAAFQHRFYRVLPSP